MVNSLLKDEFDNMGLHALSLRLKTPEEWEKEVDVASAKMGVWLAQAFWSRSDMVRREMYVIAFDVLVIVQKQLSISDLNFLGNFESTQRERVGNDTTM
jgi:hypothetical protein